MQLFCFSDWPLRSCVGNHLLTFEVFFKAAHQWQTQDHHWKGERFSKVALFLVVGIWLLTIWRCSHAFQTKEKNELLWQLQGSFLFVHFDFGGWINYFQVCRLSLKVLISWRIHLIPKWRPLNYSFVCMLIIPLGLVKMYKKQKKFEVKMRRRGLINMQTKE